MASIQDGPNPYRPYHVPASQIPPSINSTVHPTTNSSASKAGSAFDLGSSARDVLSDLDYSDYLSDASPSVLELLKKLVDQGLWKYTSILIAQPFEVAKIVLQVQDTSYVTDGDTKVEQDRGYRDNEDLYQSDDEDEDDSQSYFTSSVPSQSIRSRREYNQRRRYSSSRSRSRHSITSKHSQASARTSKVASTLKSTSSLTRVISSLWTTEGAWGVWKGTNCTFWHSVLLSTITSFLRSFFCAVFALPDPAIAISVLPSPSTLARLDVLSSPSPLTSLILSVSASGLAGLILSPLDIARTKLIATHTNQPPRSTLATVSSLGSLIIPSSIIPVTLIHSTLPTLITASTPLFLRSRLGLDNSSAPTSYAFLTFLSQAFELSIRLPVETALRRGHLQVAKDALPESSRRSLGREASTAHTLLPATTPIGAYKGLWGTWYHIIYEEGSRAQPIRASPSSAASTLRAGSIVEGKRRKGQGLGGLYRGWRVSGWGLLGMWTAHFVGGGATNSSGASGGF